jgi:glycerophosphoryl diester phosphodiesterase
MHSPIALVAHRGHQDKFPENSLLSILDALAAGALHIEFDIQLTLDKVPVLYHDDHMQRISGVDQYLTSLISDELVNFCASEKGRLGDQYLHNPITFLSDISKIINKHTDVNFYLELKEESIEKFGREACFEAILKSIEGLPNNLVFISFDEESVALAKNYGFKKSAIVLRDWKDKAKLEQKLEPDYIYANYKKIPEGETINASPPVILYELDDIQLANNLIDRGAYGIETFHIRRFLSNM